MNRRSGKKEKSEKTEEKSSTKKGYGMLFLGLFGITLLLAYGIGITSLVIKKDKEVQEVLTEVAGLTTEKEELHEEVRALSEEKKVLQDTVDVTTGELQTVGQALKDTREELEAVRGELEDLSNAPVYTFNIKEVPVGTTVLLEEIDLMHPEQYFQSYEIKEGDAIYQRIYGKSYVENPHIGLNELRYFKVLHYNFDGAIQVGELIANAALEEDYKEIFLQLFKNEYEIYSMRLVDEFWTGDIATLDEASMQANNTSAFCYRIVTDGASLSNHAYGRAIDINPLQNPYVGESKGISYWYPETAGEYVDRTTGGEHMVSADDLCYFVFRNHGFVWGGDWKSPKDYQHFEKK